MIIFHHVQSIAYIYFFNIKSVQVKNNLKNWTIHLSNLKVTFKETSFIIYSMLFTQNDLNNWFSFLHHITLILFPPSNCLVSFSCECALTNMHGKALAPELFATYSVTYNLLALFEALLHNDVSHNVLPLNSRKRMFIILLRKIRHTGLEWHEGWVNDNRVSLKKIKHWNKNVFNRTAGRLK